MIMGFIIHFYITFGTNLLTGGLAHIVVLLPVSVFQRKEYQMESKRNETFGSVIFGTNVIQRTWSGRQAINEEATRQGMRLPPWACPPPSWAPRSSTDLLLPPIYTYVPREHQQRSKNPISTATTFCTREIPSWSLFWCFPGGGIDHGGLLHHRQGISDEL